MVSLFKWKWFNCPFHNYKSVSKNETKCNECTYMSVGAKWCLYHKQMSGQDFCPAMLSKKFGLLCRHVIQAASFSTPTSIFRELHRTGQTGTGKKIAKANVATHWNHTAICAPNKMYTRGNSISYLPLQLKVRRQQVHINWPQFDTPPIKQLITIIPSLLGMNNKKKKDAGASPIVEGPS